MKEPVCVESRSPQDVLTDQFGNKERRGVKDEPTVSSQNTWDDGAALTWCAKAAEQQPRGHKKLGVGVFPVLCVGDPEWAFEHIIWNLEEA